MITKFVTYTCDFDGKNEKDNRNGISNLMVIDDYIYIPNCDGALSEISLIDGQKKVL